MRRIRGGSRRRQRVRAGAPDASLTANAGLAAVTELCDRLGVAEELDAAVGPIKQRDRGFGAGEVWDWERDRNGRPMRYVKTRSCPFSR